MLTHRRVVAVTKRLRERDYHLNNGTPLPMKTVLSQRLLPTPRARYAELIPLHIGTESTAVKVRLNRTLTFA